MGQSESDDKANNHYINTYYKGKLTKKLQMDIYADWYKKHGDDNQKVTESSEQLGINNTVVRTLSDYNILGITSKFRYTFNNRHKISAGAEFNAVGINTELNYNTQAFYNTTSKIYENKMANYIDYSYNNQKGFGLSAGLRYEWVDNSYDDLQNDKNDIKRTYRNLFPSLQLNYQTGQLNQTLSYRMRTVRPSFSYLNGNTYYVNQFMYQEGNPQLQPETLYDLQYNLMYRFIYFSAQYSYVKNAIKNDFQTESASSNVLKSTYSNFDKIEQLQAMLNLRHTFGIYTPSLTLAYMQNFMKVPTNKGLENITKPFGYIDFNNYISLKNGFLFNIQYTYTGAGTTGFLTFEPTHVFAARVQKTFFNEKLQVSLTANDIFNTQVSKINGTVNNITFDQVSNFDYRSLSLNVIWRFNNYNRTYKGQSAVQDEINRL